MVIDNIFFNGISWLLFLYLHRNSQSLIIIFVHWTQLLEYWSHDTNYTYAQFMDPHYDSIQIWINLISFLSEINKFSPLLGFEPRTCPLESRHANYWAIMFWWLFLLIRCFSRNWREINKTILNMIWEIVIYNYLFYWICPCYISLNHNQDLEVNPIKIRIGNDMVNAEASAKLLGITLDCNQKWKTQIQGQGGTISNLNARLYVIIVLNLLCVNEPRPV